MFTSYVKLYATSPDFQAIINMAAASRRTFSQLLQQGWTEIPEVLASSGMGIAGIALGFIGCYNYNKNDGDNKQYKKSIVIYRPDDPRVKLIKKA